MDPEAASLLREFCSSSSEPVVDLCKKLLKNIIKNPQQPKYRRLKNKAIESRCQSTSEYASVCLFFRHLGFSRDETYVFWELLNPDVLFLTLVISEMQKSSFLGGAKKNLAEVFPKRLGTLQIGGKVSHWSAKNNSHSGSSWGNYYVQVSFVNHFNYSMKVQWINYGGKERESSTELAPRRHTTIKAELGHPHTIRNFLTNEFICAYNPESRGEGHHVVILGETNAQRRKELFLHVLNVSENDNRTAPVMGGAPPPPPVNHRRRWE